MEHLNQALFLWINAGSTDPAVMVDIARFLAGGLIWVVPAGLVTGWLWGLRDSRPILLAAALSGMAGLLANQLISLIWYHPRPFEAGVGLTLMAHARDSSFPSDHLTLIWAVACGLLLRRQTRSAGALLALAGLPVAWARIYLGVHFPLDIFGALAVALCSAWMFNYQEHYWVGLLMRWLMPVYRRVFSGLIRRGWVRE